MMDDHCVNKDGSTSFLLFNAFILLFFKNFAEQRTTDYIFCMIFQILFRERDFISKPLAVSGHIKVTKTHSTRAKSLFPFDAI